MVTGVLEHGYGYPCPVPLEPAGNTCDCLCRLLSMQVAHVTNLERIAACGKLLTLLNWSLVSANMHCHCDGLAVMTSVHLSPACRQHVSMQVLGLLFVRCLCMLW
jgi:hypothetical protein